MSRFLLVFVFASAALTAYAEPSIEPAPPPMPGMKASTFVLPEFEHVLWGRTHYGEGYVYGPTYRGAGMSVIDIDGDDDNDFVLPGDTYDAQLQLMRNLGASGAFYPGGPRSLDVPQPASGIYWLSLSTDFADLNRDGLPDMAAVIYSFSPPQKGIGWYKNEGPADDPTFTFMGVLYMSGQSNFPGIWVDIADINDDGLNDIFFAEEFSATPATYHRIFVMMNDGSATSPSWPEFEEIPELTALMPPPIALKSALTKSGGLTNFDGAPAGALPKQAVSSSALKAGYAYRLGDIEVADWNVDGDLDFLFYDKEEGIHWIRNLGTAAAPDWDTVIASAGDPLYDHRTDDLEYVEGTFAVMGNPDPVRAETEWLDELYVVADGRLMTWRYLMSERRYRLIQTNSVTYSAGQGTPAFWDYDADGDLDMFRSAFGGTGATSYMLLFPNIGTIYNPAWGKYQVIDENASSPFLVSNGSIANQFRQDLYTFTDADLNGTQELLVQKQDGTVSCYNTVPGDADTLPTFTLRVSNMANVVLPGLSGIQPRGLAYADFYGLGSGTPQLIAAYASSDGGRVVFCSRSTLGNLSSWYAPSDVSTVLNDENGDDLSPNDIESLATCDFDGNGRTDLLVTVNNGNGSYFNCRHIYYRNNVWTDGVTWSFDYAGTLKSPQDTDYYHARLASCVDIDGDSDEDLFIGHPKYYLTTPDEEPWQYLRFYRNDSDTNLDYWRIRVVTEQSWRLWWNGESLDYSWILNASGGQLPATGWYTAGDQSRVVDVIESTELDQNVRVFIDVLPTVGTNESKAVLIIGGGASDSLYPVFRDLGAYAHWVLLLTGLPKESIRLFAPTAIDSDGDGNSDTYAAPTLAAIENTIAHSDWAGSAQRLLVYMVDHGQRDRFRLNATQYLSASEYAEWIDDLQTPAPGPQVTTVIDTCEAGTFVDNLAMTKEMVKAATQRITITGSAIGPIQGVALFDEASYISFSLGFWRNLFNGSTYGEAFDMAKIAIQAINPLQVPLIDDDGDGVPNEENDGLIAKEVRPGADFEVQGLGVYVGEIALNQTISTNSATLWLGDVVSTFPVEAAGALIVPPNFQRGVSESDDEQPVTGLDFINLAYNDNNQRWEGVYSNFSEGGLYRIQYYVNAGGRYHASPRTGFVDRINRADAWEPDGSHTSAKWLPMNSVQGHNFHQANDKDWLRFSAPAGETATIAVLSPDRRCQPIVKLYRGSDLEANVNAAPLWTQSSPVPGRGISYKQPFTTSEEYFLRINNTDGAIYGEGTSYMVIIAVGTGEIIPTTLVVEVLEAATDDPLADASVQLQGGYVVDTDSEGLAQFTCPSYGTYQVSVNKTGYQTENIQINVNNTIEKTTVELEAGEGEGEGEGDGGGCGYVISNEPDGVSGNIICIIAVCCILFMLRKRRPIFSGL